VYNSKYYDLVVLPEIFKKFIENFLNEIEKNGYGCLFYYPNEQILFPGIAGGNNKKFNLKNLEPIKSLAHMAYLIRISLKQKNYILGKYNEEEIFVERANHEKYYTLTVKKYS
jgi:hypothetical protein